MLYKDFIGRYSYLCPNNKICISSFQICVIFFSNCIRAEKLLNYSTIRNIELALDFYGKAFLFHFWIWFWDIVSKYNLYQRRISLSFRLILVLSFLPPSVLPSLILLLSLSLLLSLPPSLFILIKDKHWDRSLLNPVERDASMEYVKEISDQKIDKIVSL